MRPATARRAQGSARDCIYLVGDGPGAVPVPRFLDGDRHPHRCQVGTRRMVDWWRTVAIGDNSCEYGSSLWRFGPGMCATTITPDVVTAVTTASGNERVVHERRDGGSRYGMPDRHQGLQQDGVA